MTEMVINALYPHERVSEVSESSQRRDFQFLLVCKHQAPLPYAAQHGIAQAHRDVARSSH